MTKRVTISRITVSLILACVAAALAVASLFTGRITLDTDHVASHVADHTRRRLDILDGYASEILYQPRRGEEWPALDGIPKDMAVYKYVCDTLHSWYNLLTINNDDISPRSLVQHLSPSPESLSSPLSAATEQPKYLSLGGKWYIVKAMKTERVKVVAALLLKDGRKINDAIHLHGRYDIAPLGETDGSPVVIGGEPVFKVTASTFSATGNYVVTALIMRWVAIVLLLLALMLYLSSHRNMRTCAVIIGAIVMITAFARLLEGRLADYGHFFSPTLYAHDGLLDSFATLIIFNTAIFLSVLCLYLCRDSIAAISARSRKNAWCCMTGATLAIAALVCYTMFTLVSLMRNSSINLELYRVYALSWYSAIVYVSYAFLLIGVLLLIETALCAYCIATGSQRRVSIMTRGGILAFATIAAMAVCIPSAVISSAKESSRIAGWSSRLALDRNLGMELDMRRVESAVAADPVLSVMVYASGANALIVHRLEEMYFGRLTQDYDVSVKTMGPIMPKIDADLDEAIVKGTPIAPGSHFLYNYSPVYGSKYTGIFPYYASNAGTANLIVEITPKYARASSLRYANSLRTSSGVGLPQFYSFAKYNNNALASFWGNYAYPMVLDGIVGSIDAGRGSFVSNGYRHFLNKVSDDETVIISRRERRLNVYLSTFSFVILLLFLTGALFKPSSRGMDLAQSRYFSARMRRLIICSLSITLVTMATVSVLFVYQRNNNNLSNIMSGRISSIQVMLDRSCRNMNSSLDMMDAAFARQLEDISKSTSSDIALFSTGGRLLMNTDPDIMQRWHILSRINPEAYRNIMFKHQRYCILKDRSSRPKQRTMYCPVFNAASQTIAIAAVPYMDTDYDFTRDAVVHAATIVSLFLILLFITVLLSSGITSSVFRPLIEMGEKMKLAQGGVLEEIVYEGNDEISSLVASYNTMVSDLRDSTVALAAAERDKAWSEMARQVAHEIKNPLTPIKLEIQRLSRLKQKNDPTWTEKFDRMTSVVLEHIDILSQTASEFSTFAKLYSEEPVEIDLDKVISDQLLLFGESGAKITYLGSENAVIMGPKPQLIRVFVNLLTNAVQATDGKEDAAVVVSLRRSAATENAWDVVFEDNGPGVSAENQSKLFTPNFTTKSSGTGLGLAICKSIVSRCGGSISYSRSFSLGGACFTVTLPASGNVEPHSLHLLR